MTEYPTSLIVKNHPTLSRYAKLCWMFILYLQDKENIYINIEGGDFKKSEYIEFLKPYLHRWRPEYMKARLAKLYLLDAWAKNNPLPLSMLTFTTYHDSDYAHRKIGRGYTIEESWKMLKDGFWRASMLIRNKIRKGVSYFWIIEPQIESGYPHIHAGYFTEFTDDEKGRLKNHWARVVEAGDFEHGLDFSFTQNYESGDISSFRNYLMKYMGKTFHDGMSEWTAEELVFNAIAWNEGYRLFGCSRDLSKVMKGTMEKKRDFTWIRTSLTGRNLTDDVEIELNKNSKIKFTSF